MEKVSKNAAPPDTKGSGKRKRVNVWDQHRALVESAERDEAEQKIAKLTRNFYERKRREAAEDGEEQDEEDPAGDLYEDKTGDVEYWEEDGEEGYSSGGEMVWGRSLYR